MGSLNATGHVLTVAAGGSIDELFDLIDEMAERARGEDAGVTIHSMGKVNDPRIPRYCVHPDGHQEVEFRGDELHATMVRAAMWLAKELPSDLLWRRG